MKYILDHASMGFCWWDLVAFVALVVLFFYCRKKIKDMLQLKNELESKLNGESVDTAIQNEEAQPAPVPLTEEEAAQQQA